MIDSSSRAEKEITEKVFVYSFLPPEEPGLAWGMKKRFLKPLSNSKEKRVRKILHLRTMLVQSLTCGWKEVDGSTSTSLSSSPSTFEQKSGLERELIPILVDFLTF